jgi:hypothetical protein
MKLFLICCNSHPVSDGQKALMEANADYPLFTLIFDREG